MVHLFLEEDYVFFNVETSKITEGFGFSIYSDDPQAEAVNVVISEEHILPNEN